jgi:hypothetical protein
MLGFLPNRNSNNGQALTVHARTAPSVPLQSMHFLRIAFSPLAPVKRFSIG